MHKKGFTVVELMTTFALISVISVLLIKLTITLKEIYINGDIKTALLTKQGNMTDKIYKDLKENKLVSITSCGINCVDFKYDTIKKTLKIDNDKKILTYDNYSIKLGEGGYFDTVYINNYVSDIGVILNLNIPIHHKLLKGDYGININYQTDVLNYDDSIIFDVTKDNSLYKEEILNGADPVLKDNLIPVVISDDGIVTKANTKKEWYNYEDHKWANAVILKENGKIESDNTIKEESIKEYYVWIPKYSYKLWNVNSDNIANVKKPIEITFGSKAKTTGTSNGDTLIHPAFTNFNTNGIWVGKYEISYDEESYTNKDTFLIKNPNTSVTTDPTKLIVKPNVRSLTYKNVSSLFTLIKNSHTNLNSHMMTNMEWGATAYLTYSKYGRCTSETCTEVTINNINTGYYGSSAKFTGEWQYGPTITGCAGDTVSAGVISNSSDCTNKYNTAKGYLASTTGNITGIYDMSGGSWEYVMGVLEDSNGNLYSGNSSSYNSGFKGLYSSSTGGSNTTGLDFPDKKYYDSYKSSDAIGTDKWYIYTSGKLGDATKEIANTKANSSSGDSGLWFSDYARFATPTTPWFLRGGSWVYDTGAGVFLFSRDNGNASGSRSARSVLAY